MRSGQDRCGKMASRWSPAISRVLCPRPLPRAGDGHSSRPLVTERLVRPTWNLFSTRATSAGKPRGSDSVLLQVGFAMPLPSPGERCALTTPFHPCLTTGLPTRSGGLLSVALSFESSRLAVNQHPAQGARTFLDGEPSRPSTELQREADPSIARLRSAPCPILLTRRRTPLGLS